jgi:transcriptional regulator with XRE-family HTH domain
VTFGDEMRRLLAARGVSLRELSRRTHYDVAYLSRAMRGLQRPSPELAEAVDHELSADGVLARLATEQDAVGTVLTPDDAERLALAEASPQRVDAAVLDSVAGMLAATRRLEDATSAATVLPVVREHLALVNRFAADAHSTVRPQAVGLASELHQYAGWLHVPLRRWKLAERLLDRAVVLGLEAGDPQRTAAALSFAAYTAMRRGELHKAHALSDAAGRDERTDIGLRTYIAYQRAELLAMDGEPASAYRLLGEADAMVDRLPDPADLPGSGYWYVPEFFLGNHAFVLDRLGEPCEARRLMAESLASLPEEWRDSEWAQRRRAFVLDEPA